MRPGDVIADRFELTRLAASGGMGSVYLARDLRTGEAVAVKTIRGCEEAHQAARFEREAHLLAQLEHPAIVRYVAHGRSEGKGDGEHSTWSWSGSRARASRRGSGAGRHRDGGARGEAHCSANRDISDQKV